MSSHRFHRFAQKLLILVGALVSSAPTKQTMVLPQIAQIYTEVRLPSGGKTRKQYALKGQKHIAQGNALGKYAPH